MINNNPIYEKKINLLDKNRIYNLLKTHKKTGEGFGNCISGFWDDQSIMELTEIIIGEREELK